MLISGVNALTCNTDLIAWNDSRYVLPNVGLRSLQVPFGSWQIQGNPWNPQSLTKGLLESPPIKGHLTGLQTLNQQMNGCLVKLRELNRGADFDSTLVLVKLAGDAQLLFK